MTGFIADSVRLPALAPIAASAILSPLLQRFITTIQHKQDVYLVDEKGADADSAYRAQHDLMDEILASDDALAKEAVLSYVHLIEIQLSDRQASSVRKRFEDLVIQHLSPPAAADERNAFDSH
jgi:hypothetical protein